MTRQGTILIVDDEFDSAIVMAVRRSLDEEGWSPVVVRPEGNWSTADEFEDATLYAIEESQPDGVLLDVRFGDQADDRFKGLDILQSIVEQFPKLPVLMFTQYTQGPDRDTAVRGALTQGSFSRLYRQAGQSRRSGPAAAASHWRVPECNRNRK